MELRRAVVNPLHGGHRQGHQVPLAAPLPLVAPGTVEGSIEQAFVAAPAAGQHQHGTKAFATVSGPNKERDLQSGDVHAPPLGRIILGSELKEVS